MCIKIDMIACNEMIQVYNINGEEKEILCKYKEYLQIKDALEQTNYSKIFECFFVVKNKRSLVEMSLKFYCDVRTLQRYRQKFLNDIKVLKETYNYIIET